MKTRLSSAWHRLRARWRTSDQLAQQLATAEAEIRKLRRAARADAGNITLAAQDSASLRSELREVRSTLAEREQEIARLENRIDLLTESLEYQLQWREKEVEKLRAEAAIYTRRRVEAVTGELNLQTEE